ncbi:MAG: DUF4424 family protein [Candidatus Latescibacteria bacterium]|nr:DUF4424 family protein [Candidatus Latescibacterota bacterium]
MFIWGSCTKPQGYPVRFVSEEIRISIDRQEVSVNAVYYFQNFSRELKTGLIFYPFPIDQYHYYPDSIVIAGYDFTRNDSGVNYVMRFRPNAQETVKVFYAQKLKANQTRYILTTTQSWKSPLKQARFIVDMPSEFSKAVFSYEPDSVRLTENRRRYYINEKNFMPDKDLIVNW